MSEQPRYGLGFRANDQETPHQPRPPSRESFTGTLEMTLNQHDRFDEHDFTNYQGCVFPTQAKDVTWAGGRVKTKLPWISDPQAPNNNYLIDVSYYSKNIQIDLYL